jgi:hypothetical protein
MDDLAPAVWRKSTRSNEQGACVEVADLDDGGRAVRDSKHPDGGYLTFTGTEFTTGVKSGEFD